MKVNWPSWGGGNHNARQGGKGEKSLLSPASKQLNDNRQLTRQFPTHRIPMGITINQTASDPK